MPNWFEGMLKIRGKQEDVFNLLADNLQVWKTIIVKEPKFDIREELDKEAIKIDREERDRHCVDISYADLKKRYKTPYAWVLSKIEPIEDIWYYEHPKGAVIWVKNVQPIDEMRDERIRYGY